MCSRSAARCAWYCNTALAVERYLNAWFAAGGQQGFYLQSHGGYSKNGYWGLMEDLFKPDTPKKKAAVRVAERVATTRGTQSRQ